MLKEQCEIRTRDRVHLENQSGSLVLALTTGLNVFSEHNRNTLGLCRGLRIALYDSLTLGYEPNKQITDAPQFLLGTGFIRAWQEPEPSHVTGMALVHCILGKYLGVVCHCFPAPLDVPTLAARCLRPQ